MEIKVIKTESDYELALARLDEIFEAPSNTKEGGEAEILAMLIGEYEKKHWSIEESKLTDLQNVIKKGLGSGTATNFSANTYLEKLKKQAKMIDTINREDRINTILQLVENLSDEEQKTLLLELEKKSMLEKAAKLEAGTKDNSLTMEEIVSEVLKVRAANG